MQKQSKHLYKPLGLICLMLAAYVTARHIPDKAASSFVATALPANVAVPAAHKDAMAQNPAADMRRQEEEFEARSRAMMARFAQEQASAKAGRFAEIVMYMPPPAPGVSLEAAQPRRALVDAAHKMWQLVGDPAQAEAMFRLALEMETQTHLIETDMVWCGLVETLNAQGRAREALAILDTQIYDREVPILTNQMDYGVTEMRLDWGTLWRYARLCERYGRRDQAMQIYHKILAIRRHFQKLERANAKLAGIKPEDFVDEIGVPTDVTNSLQVRASASVLAGNRFAGHLEAQPALECAHEAVRLRPRWGMGHYSLACALVWTGSRREGLAEYAKAIRLADPPTRKFLKRHYSDWKQTLEMKPYPGVIPPRPKSALNPQT